MFVEIRSNGKKVNIEITKKNLENFIIKEYVVKNFKKLKNDRFDTIKNNIEKDSYTSTEFKRLLRNGINDYSPYGPNKEIYWINRGFDDKEAKMFVFEHQSKAIKKKIEKYGEKECAKGLIKYLKESSVEKFRKNSHRCAEYWIEKGYTIEEAKKEVKTVCDNSSLDYFIEKYGKKDGKIRYKNRCKELSIKLSGDKNPMYNKPSPNGSGNGWSGWYKTKNNKFYFRSLLELSYINYMDENNIEFETAEKNKYSVEYIDYNGHKRNYFPDFYLFEDDCIVEIKPKNLLNSKNNKIKFEEAAKRFDNFKVITDNDINKLSFDKIKMLQYNKKIEFIDKYKEKFEEWERTNESSIKKRNK